MGRGGGGAGGKGVLSLTLLKVVGLELPHGLQLPHEDHQLRRGPQQGQNRQGYKQGGLGARSVGGWGGCQGGGDGVAWVTCRQQRKGSQAAALGLQPLEVGPSLPAYQSWLLLSQPGAPLGTAGAGGGNLKKEAQDGQGEAAPSPATQNSKADSLETQPPPLTIPDNWIEPLLLLHFFSCFSIFRQP